MLVVPCHPQWKVDIEVVASILGVTRCYACKWAAKPIRGQNNNLESYYGDQSKRAIKVSTPRDERESDNAPREERPHKRVNCLNNTQRSDRWICATRIHAV
jgi:hypothetical protein